MYKNSNDLTREHIYMPHRIHKIMLVCCRYDAYILEEDGHIEQQIKSEYHDLGLSDPPSITHIQSTAEALELLARDSSFDFIITMYNVGEPDVFEFSKIVKQRHPNIPISLLTSFTKDLYGEIASHKSDSIESTFCWLGNADIILGIIKQMEDKLNAEDDILNGGTQAILLVEDSVRFYSTYLPELYKLILTQNSLFLEDAYNEQQQILRRRSRPKILHATNYAEALELYTKYQNNLLGVISDVHFALNREEEREQKHTDAGITLCKLIKEQTPLMPVLMQSSHQEYGEIAHGLGAGFIPKNSKRLIAEMTRFIEREFAFGDLVFTSPTTGVEVGRAQDLKGLECQISTIPDDVFTWYASQNNLSKWLYARGLFPLAREIRAHTRADFESIEQHRASIVALIGEYRTLLGQGVIANFESKSYSDTISFARIGDGSIGGKARGIAFMNNAIIRHQLYQRWEGVRVTIPRSVVVATNYFDEFISMNGLGYIIQKEGLPDEQILAEFLAATPPPALMEHLRAFIETVDTPLAIRSSSKLEDSHYQPFAGIYSTYMIPYVDDRHQMLRMLVNAIKGVYASIYYSASRSYITSSQNLLSEEKMAVIIQEVCGTAQDDIYMPTFSGVARSINSYPIGDEKAEEGMCKVAMGLGKLVMDGGQVLRFSPSHPKKVLQTSTMELMLRDTQREVVALSLKSEEFKSSVSDDANLREIAITDIGSLRQSRFVCSTFNAQDGRIEESPRAKGRKIITFNPILKYDSFPLADIVKTTLELGQAEMCCPVEIEFAVDMDVANGAKPIFYLLQIRPIISYLERQKVDWNTIQSDGALISSSTAMGVGKMEGISDIIYVKTDSFSSLKTREIAAELEGLNKRMEEQKRGYILVGMGRWGSSDPFLGVPVNWRHISGARVVVERSIDGFDIEPSQGTHFFQNLTSLGVGYITIDSHSEDIYNAESLDAMSAEWEGEYLKLVHFDRELTVLVDGVEGKALICESNSIKSKEKI